MPFNSSGVYSPPAGAESAAPSQVIRSATWNTIFTDISAALTLLGQQVLAAPRIISTPGSFTVAVSDAVILVKANAPVITLPLSSSKVGPVQIVGAATGIFSSHNAAVTPTGGDTISGLTGVTLAADYEALQLYPLASGGYVVI